MKILITGGSGNVGTALTRRLVKKGWDVRVLGLEAEADLPGATYIHGDIMDYATVVNAVQDRDAVIHLAAIANPMRFPAPKTFEVNVAGTYNVFEAAANAGISRVVQASSINAFGCFWGTVEISPQYLPIDEAHPTHTTDVYSFSKQMVEEIADYYWRRAGISSASFRFPGVWTAARIENSDRATQKAAARATLEELLGLSDSERAARLEQIRDWSDDYRSRKQMEHPAAQNGFAPAPYTDDPLWQMYTFQRFNFFAYIHEEDSAQAMEKAVTAEYSGAHPLFVNSAYNSADYDAQTLARLFFPDSELRAGELGDAAALVSINKARKLIGFKPEHVL
ncbi:MAG: NAD(P)-dependent oxidoreductase [Litorilinea sp.]